MSKLPPDPPTTDECEAILKTAIRRYRSPHRNRALMAILWQCGLRSAEARGLRVEDYRPGGLPTLRILLPKGALGGKPPRTVGMSERAVVELESWLEHRGDYPGYIFDTHAGGQLSGRYLRTAVKLYARRAGVSRRIHPHGFRHAFARDLHEEGIGSMHIKEALGHSKLALTERYLSSLGCNESVAVLCGR